MRLGLVAWAIAAICAVSAQAAPPGKAKVAQDAVDGEAPGAEGKGGQDTLFNDIKVPPMKEIEGDEFTETIKEGYW